MSKEHAEEKSENSDSLDIPPPVKTNKEGRLKLKKNLRVSGGGGGGGDLAN